VSLAGQVSLVTGAGNGIGRATVDALLRDGATVIAVDRDAAALQQLAEERPGVVTVEADVANPDGVARAVATAGDVDFLCNNAGLMDSMRLLDEQTLEEWGRIFDVNVTGPFLFCKAVLPSMLRRRTGLIINVASIAGLRGGRAGAAYTASKHALVGLTRNIAAMYGPDGVRCIAVCPGGIAGSARGGQEPGTTFSERGAARIMGRDARAAPYGVPEDIADVIVALARPDARYMTGAIVVADGGATAY